MSLQSISKRAFGKLERPTALVLGVWDEAVFAALRRRFPTCWTPESLPEHLSTADVDYVIAGPGSDQQKFAMYLRYNRLIMINMLPTPEPPIDFYGFGKAGNIQATPKTTHPIIHNALSSELGQIEDFSQWTILRESTTPGIAARHAPPALLAHAIVVNKKNEVLGFVTDPKNSPFKSNKYKACLQWQPQNAVGCINTIIEYWAHSVPEDHPFHIPWGAQRDWMTPEEREAFDEIESLNKEEEVELLRINTARTGAAQRLHAHRLTAEQGIKKLLTTQDEELVDITVITLRSMGFSVRNLDDTSPTGQRIEDLEITHTDFDGKTILCEVKGFDKSGGKLSDLARLRKHINRFNREQQREPYRSWFIVNGQSLKPPTLRDQPYKSDREAVRSLEEEGILVISTCDLYRLINDERLTPDARRDALLKKMGGVFRYPPDN